ncbi:MAG: CSLREA domain-containing protein, partial [Anaerolineales bacterium]|nr:CSLREA domain-containing protein [Anaerolineales bacterium]
MPSKYRRLLTATLFLFAFLLINPWTRPLQAAGSGSALSFDGNDRVYVPHNANLNATVFTYEAWIYPTNISAEKSIVSKGTGLGGADSLFQILNGRMRLFTNTFPWHQANTVVPLNAWSHVAVTRDAAGTVTFYLNGVPDGSVTGTSAPTPGTNNFYIGLQGATCQCNGFIGQMDEVRVWNVARTQSEIQATMSQSLTGSEPNLISYWNFDAGSGQTVSDMAGTNDGTLGETAAISTDDPAWVASTAPISSFVVNSTDDAGDANPGDGVCATAVAQCTLRAAIEEANAQPGTDTIYFNIPGGGVHTFTPASAYPAMTESVVIDGTTQPGASCAAWPPTLLIELDGTNAGSANALDIRGNSTVRGLVINRFFNGIHLANSSNNHIECNFLGTDASGTSALGNTLAGVYIQQISIANTIGGAADSQRNLIAGNGDEQIGLFNYGSAPNNNVIENNYIGTDVSGTVALGGGNFGAIALFGGNGNAILNNLISGNASMGIEISGDAGRIANGNIVQGNLIGTDVSGSTFLGNGSGISLGAFGNPYVQNTLVGTNGDGVNDAAEGNLIAGNIGNGVELSASSATNINNLVRRNSIYGNGALGIDLGNDGATANDLDDADGGSNYLQNYPILTAV